MIVTTSWDDGDVRDLRIADLLLQRGLPGTFYVPLHPFGGSPALTPDNLRAMTSAGLEIGAHGVDHEIMSELSFEHALRVVGHCKCVLEERLGAEVPMFCYPRGRYNSDTIRCLKKVGYRGARTVQMVNTHLSFGPFEMPTSSQVYPHASMRYLRNMARGRNFRAMYEYLVDLRYESNWVKLSKKLFDRALEHNGIWHIYGHSWEIDELGLWDGLKEVLDYASKRDNVLYLTNGALVNHLTAGSPYRLLPITSYSE
jgi:peptidoglycan/xylan/chitin deacetylase (PgdA/CDA1 family)